MLNVFGKQWSGRQRHLALLAVLVAVGAGTFGERWHAQTNLTLAKAESAAIKKATRNLAYALRSNDDDLIRRLTTAQGYQALERARRSKKLGSYPKVSERMIKEWMSNVNPCSLLKMNQEDDTSACSYVRTADARFGMSHLHQGKPDGEIVWKRAGKVWTLDGYKPSEWFHHSTRFRLHASAMAQMLERNANIAVVTAP